MDMNDRRRIIRKPDEPGLFGTPPQELDTAIRAVNCSAARSVVAMRTDRPNVEGVIGRTYNTLFAALADTNVPKIVKTQLYEEHIAWIGRVQEHLKQWSVVLQKKYDAAIAEVPIPGGIVEDPQARFVDVNPPPYTRDGARRHLAKAQRDVAAAAQPDATAAAQPNVAAATQPNAPAAAQPVAMAAQPEAMNVDTQPAPTQ